MGYYSDYLNKQMNFSSIIKERKTQLKKISSLLNNSDVLVYASDMGNLGKRAPISIDYTDIQAVDDQLSNINSKELTVILETPGGSGEIVEDLVRMIRDKYEYVRIIIPGYAKSAGTIFAMSGDEILMGDTSALGPIDAQVVFNGKVFSADALLEKYKDIRKEIEETKKLNPIYIPTLQSLSLGELKTCENAQNFSKELVSKWLYEYKFKNWSNHSEDNTEVSDEEKRERANEIACELRANSKWLTHGKSLKIDDLRNMKLEIRDYREEPELAEAIDRFYALLKMSFDANIYKIIETANSQIYRMLAMGINPPSNNNLRFAEVEFICPKCKTHHIIQANVGTSSPIKAGNKPFPKNNMFQCDKCGTVSNLINLRNQIEAEAKKRIVS